jgi:hypothetical protein
MSLRSITLSPLTFSLVVKLKNPLLFVPASNSTSYFVPAVSPVTVFAPAAFSSAETATDIVSPLGAVNKSLSTPVVGVQCKTTALSITSLGRIGWKNCTPIKVK